MSPAEKAAVRLSTQKRKIRWKSTLKDSVYYIMQQTHWVRKNRIKDFTDEPLRGYKYKLHINIIFNV